MKLIVVPFGVPFDHTYYNDLKFNSYLKAEASNRPPKIFGFTDGFKLASSGNIYSTQCAKCGISGDFSVEGSLAFSTKNGVTRGKVSFMNVDPFTIDAQFGITGEAQSDEAVEELTRQLGVFPLSPLTIPGIITLGPEVSISAAFDLVLNEVLPSLFMRIQILNIKYRGLAIVKTADKDYQTYGIILTKDGHIDLWYATVCKTDKGLRLYATIYLIDKDGNLTRNQNFIRRRMDDSFRNLGVD